MGLIQKRAAGQAQTTAARGPSAGRFSYRARTAEEVKARANRQVGSRESYLGGVDFFTPPAGDNALRIMPPTFDGAAHYGLDLHIHYGIGPDKNAYLCLDKMKGEACPLCEARAVAADAGEEGLAKHLRPRQRVLAWVINRKEEGKGPLAWSMPAGLDKDIVNCSKDPQSGEWLAIDHPESGYDVFFKRIGIDEKTEYTGIVIARNSSPMSDDPDKMARWMGFIEGHQLPALLQYRAYDELQAAYAGTTTDRKDAKGAAPQAAAPAARVPVRRAAAAPAKAAAPAPAAAAPAPAQGEPPAELPTWEEIHQFSEADLEALIKDCELVVPGEGAPDAAAFESLLGIQDWVCAQLEIASPAPATPAPAAGASGGSWKDKLAKMRQGGAAK